jgi:hypothetical protein
MQLQPLEQQNLQGEKSKISASFFFLCLGLLITLITSVVSFLNLVFETLNKRFPDVLNATYQYGYSSYEYESIRMSLATLIIFFPIFIIVSYFWNKHLRTELNRIDEMVKKWLIYILLFLSALVTAVDLVALVRYFVSGEITTRFALKVLAVFVVALYVGVYFIFKLKGKEKIFGFNLNVATMIKSGILVLAVIVWSFTVIGTPGKQRMLRLDDRRVGDLQSIQYQVITYWQQKERLPEKISDLSSPISGYSLPVDPEFEKGKTYEYNVKGPLTFEICADFALPIPKGWREYKGYGGALPTMEQDIAMPYPYPVPIGGTNESWEHQAGRTCFERTIDKDIYPPFPKPEQSKI